MKYKEVTDTIDKEEPLSRESIANDSASNVTNSDTSTKTVLNKENNSTVSNKCEARIEEANLEDNGIWKCDVFGITIILYKNSNKDSDPNKGGEADNIHSSAAKLKLKSNGMTDAQRVKARAERFSMSNKTVDEKKASRAQ